MQLYANINLITTVFHIPENTLEMHLVVYHSDTRLSFLVVCNSLKNNFGKIKF